MCEAIAYKVMDLMGCGRKCVDRIVRKVGQYVEECVVSGAIGGGTSLLLGGLHGAAAGAGYGCLEGIGSQFVEDAFGEEAAAAYDLTVGIASGIGAVWRIPDSVYYPLTDSRVYFG